MKENILFVILVCAGIGAGFAVGLYVGTDRTEDRQEAQRQHSHASRDTSMEVRETTKPRQEKESRPAPKITPEVQYAADSSFTRAQQQGEDTLRALYLAAVAPRDTAVIFPGIGELRHRSDRLRGVEYYSFQPFPQKDTLLIITDTIYLPTLAPRPPSITVSKVSLVGLGATAGGFFGGPIGAGGGGVAGLIADWIFFED